MSSYHYIILLDQLSDNNYCRFTKVCVGLAWLYYCSSRKIRQTCMGHHNFSKAAQFSLVQFQARNALWLSFKHGMKASEFVFISGPLVFLVFVSKHFRKSCYIYHVLLRSSVASMCLVAMSKSFLRWATSGGHRVSNPSIPLTSCVACAVTAS